MGHGGNGLGLGLGRLADRVGAVSGDGLAGGRLRWFTVGWWSDTRQLGTLATCVGLCRFGEAWAALGAENLLTYLNEAAGQLGGRQDRERERSTGSS
jgi:hypothetical protein